MASSYDSTKDRYYTIDASVMSKSAVAVPLSDTVDMLQYGRIVVLDAGDVKFLPAKNDDAAPIVVSISAAMCPWFCPWVTRRVWATGTTCTKIYTSDVQV